VTAVRLRGVHLLGVAVNIDYDDKEFCVALQQAAVGSTTTAIAATLLELRPLRSGGRVPVTDARACVPIQPVELAGVAFS
jgi:hypothetical protein